MYADVTAAVEHQRYQGIDARAIAGCVVPASIIRKRVLRVGRARRVARLHGKFHLTRAVTLFARSKHLARSLRQLLTITTDPSGTRVAIGTARLRWGKLRIPVSAAYGVYSFSGADDAQVAIEAADKAMYQRKRVVHTG